jgi:hypothetical protein
MKNLLIILKVREIEHVLASYRNYKMNRVFIAGYKESELEDLGIFSSVIQSAKEKGYTHISVISDDGLITNKAFDKVLELSKENPVVTAFCKIDKTSTDVNLAKSPLIKAQPYALQDYHLFDYSELPNDTNIRTYFTGMALTTMPIELWEMFPFKCYREAYAPNGYASDYHLSKRLQDAGIPIYTHKDTEVIHEKEKHSTNIGQKLFIGKEYRNIIWEEIY